MLIMAKDSKTIIGTGPKKPEREPSKKACLVIITDKNIGKTYFLNQPETILGRAEDADFIIDDALISRKHTKITLVDENNILIVQTELM